MDATFFRLVYGTLTESSGKLYSSGCSTSEGLKSAENREFLIFSETNFLCPEPECEQVPFLLPRVLQTAIRF